MLFRSPAPSAAPAGFGAFAAAANGVAPRRQQAWPAEHQVGVGSGMGLGAGYGFPGFGFAQGGAYVPPGAAREAGVGVVGGELVF